MYLRHEEARGKSMNTTQTMTRAEYKAFGPRPAMRPCPNPTCYDGRDTGREIGLFRAVYGYGRPVYATCGVCKGLGSVEVVP